MTKKVTFSDNVDVIYYDRNKPIKQNYNLHIFGFLVFFIFLILCLL